MPASLPTGKHRVGFERGAYRGHRDPQALAKLARRTRAAQEQLAYETVAHGAAAGSRPQRAITSPTATALVSARGQTPQLAISPHRLQAGLDPVGRQSLPHRGVAGFGVGEKERAN